MTTQNVAAKSNGLAKPSTRFTVTRCSPSLWRATFHNPPINLIDPVMVVELHRLLNEIEQDKEVAVVMFDSADPDFFLAHYDIAADASAYDALPAAPSPLHHWSDFLIRLGKSQALFGGEDFDGELAERYGYVNRAVPTNNSVRSVIIEVTSFDC